MARAYGVLRGFGLYAARVTIYVDREGRVAEIDRDVDTARAGEQMASRLEALGVPRSRVGPTEPESPEPR